MQKLSGTDQVLVGERSGVDDPLQSITKDMRIVPVVESPFQFLQVAIKIVKGGEKLGQKGGGKIDHSR